MVINIIYACDSCQFLFQRIGAVERCPQCEKNYVRPATEAEAEDFKKQIEESKVKSL